MEWSFDPGKTERRFPNGITMADFGRVLKYSNVQISDSGTITCQAFHVSEPGNVVTSSTLLNGM